MDRALRGRIGTRVRGDCVSDVQGVSVADRYAGTLLGLACGEASGSPLEFRNRDEIAAALPESWKNRVQFRDRLESEATRLLGLSEDELVTGS